MSCTSCALAWALVLVVGLACYVGPLVIDDWRRRGDMAKKPKGKKGGGC